MFDPSEYAGRVDCLHAGFPCTDISLAGKRAGVGPETRSGLYREVLRCAGVIRPRYLFLENVAAIISVADKRFIAFFEKCIQIGIFGAANPESITGRYIRRVIEIRLQAAIGTVLGDLAALGYDAEWLCLRASDCGAPHRRDRWWCLAERADADIERCGEARRLRPDTELWNGGICEAVADANQHARHERRQGNATQEPRGRHADRGGERAGIPDAILERLERQQQAGATARTAHGPGHGRDTGGRKTESGMGGLADVLAAGPPENQWWQIEPDTGRVTDESKNRVSALKALGNGQVPIQAALAWRILGGP